MNNRDFLLSFKLLSNTDTLKTCRAFDNILYLYNAFAIDVGREMIYVNNDDNFLELTLGMDPIDIKNSLYFGKYEMADAFIMFNGYGNIQTLHYTHDLFNLIDNDFALWASDNEIDLLQVSGIIE